MAAAKMVLGTIPGVDRPALAAVVPNRRGRTVVLDVGANVEAKPHHLRQFAVMGHFYAQEVIGRPAPRIGLLSIGEEEGKGTDLTREVYKVLESTGINFVGNVEGHELFNGAVDVVVCDGFVGNAVLKSSESLARLIGSALERDLRLGWRAKVGALLVKPALEKLRQSTDPNEYGAAPLLGVRGGCFIGHGSSSSRGIFNSVRRAVEFCAADVHQKIRDRMAVMHSQEKRLLGDDESWRAGAEG
jgi:glycerol-3-phosphate acyltransferase PlsX